MILVDTSVWVDHFRNGNKRLSHLLLDQQVVTHPMIIGELACGTLRNRSEILQLLDNLPKAAQATHAEVLHMIEERKLMRRGIGYADAHLLASTLLTPGTQLWTLDRKLQLLGG
jgi:predicted nucleic acid-binding protein